MNIKHIESCQMLVYVEKGRTEYPGKNLSESLGRAQWCAGHRVVLLLQQRQPWFAQGSPSRASLADD